MFHSMDMLLIVTTVMYIIIIIGLGVMVSWKKLLKHIWYLSYNLAWLGVGIWFFSQPITPTLMAYMICMPMILGLYLIGSFFPWFFDSLL